MEIDEAEGKTLEELSKVCGPVRAAGLAAVPDVKPGGRGRAWSLYATPPSPFPPPPPPPSFKRGRCGGHGANGAKFFVPCLVERGTMPLVLKTLKTFFPAKMRNRYYRIHTSIPPCPPDTHTPLRYACGGSGLRAAPPPPRPSCQYPPADPPPPRKF